MIYTGNKGTLTLKNTIAISIEACADGYYWAGTVSKSNVKRYTSKAALMAALTETTFDGWNSPFTFEDGKLKFGGVVVLQ